MQEQTEQQNTISVCSSKQFFFKKANLYCVALRYVTRSRV